MTADSSVASSASGTGSSSAPREPGVAVAAAAAASPPHPVPPQGPDFIEKWGVPILGMALTAVIGYFSTILLVKDDIARNRESIAVMRVEFTHIQTQVTDINGTLKSNIEVAKDMAVLKSRIEGIELRIAK